MYQKLCSQFLCGEIVNAARTVRDVPQDDDLRSAEPVDDVRDDACVHQQTLGELQGDSFD